MRLNIVSMIIDDVGLWYDNDMENLALVKCFLCYF